MEGCMRGMLKRRGGVDVFEEGHRGVGNGGRVRWMLFHLMSRREINLSHYMLQSEPV